MPDPDNNIDPLVAKEATVRILEDIDAMKQLMLTGWMSEPRPCDAPPETLP